MTKSELWTFYYNAYIENNDHRWEKRPDGQVYVPQIVKDCAVDHANMMTKDVKD